LAAKQQMFVLKVSKNGLDVNKKKLQLNGLMGQRGIVLVVVRRLVVI